MLKIKRRVLSILLSLVMVITMIPVMNSEEVKAANYESDYRKWNQGRSDNAWMRDYGCLVTAHAKMLYEEGVNRGGLNPDVLYAYLQNNGGNNNWGLTGSGPYVIQNYANLYGKKIKFLGNWDASENQIWFNIRAGYYTIVHLNIGHWVMIDNKTSLSTGQIYIYDSFAWGFSANTSPMLKNQRYNGVYMDNSYVYKSETPPVVIPQTPTNVKINKTDIGLGDGITATWNASSGATKYNVNLVCTTNSAYNQSTQVGGTSATFSINRPGTYKVIVSASNSVGTSGSNSSGNCVAHDNVVVKYVDWDNELIGQEQSVKWGGNAVAPTAPPREGYTFQSWSTDGKNITANTTIKAQYKINTYSVSFIDYNGDIINKVQKIEYSSAAIEPTDVPCKKGYIFTGWDTNDWKNVKKSLTVKATYVWENSDLPIITEIKSAKRNDEATGYNISVDLTNFPDNFTKGKLVVALMTKEGKMVASETRSISMPETGEVNENIMVLYSGLASMVQVSMVGVIDDETTGTPKSKVVTSAVDIGNEWSDWSTTVPEGNDIIKESRTEYRHKDCQVIKSTGTPTTPLGYSLTSTTNTGTYTSWGAFSNWSRSWVGSNTLVNVQTTTGYRYYAFRCSRCGTHDPYSGACSNCGSSMYWVEEWGTTNGYNYGYTWVNSSKGKIWWMNNWWYFEFNGCSDGQGGYGQPTCTLYRYQTRQEYKNYTYWQNEFSDWQADKVEESSTKQVETRTTYRFKTNSTEVPCYNYKRYKYTNINNGKIVYTYTSKYADSMEYPGEWEYYKTFTELKKVATVDDDIELYNGTGEDSWYKADVNNESSSNVYETQDTLEDTKGVHRTVEGILEGAAGKVATLLVYKGQNEDPIASQIEYIGQVKIGTEGKYKFDFITKEEPTAKTGDFIVTLGLEGSTNYQVIDRIEAPKQVFTVDFVDDEGNSIGEQKKVVDGGTVIAPNVPEKEGYDFIGWDTGLKNIRENMVITAQYKKKTYTVIFVDWDNTSIDVKTYEHGSELTIDTVPEKAGQKFEKWVNSDGNEVKNVTSNMIVEASYKDTKYTIIFRDWEGNVISQQELSYGEQAKIPEDLEAPNDKQVFQSWDRYANAMYVTSDAIISPVAKYIKDSEKPKFTIMSGAYEDKQTVGIYSLKSDTDIYYKVVNDNDDYCFEPVEPTDFIKYEDELLISKSSIVYAYAVTKDSNRSEIEQLVVKISDEGETNPIEPPTTEEVTTPKPIETTSEEVTTLNPIETTSDEIVTTEKVTTPISTETTTNQEVTTNAPTTKYITPTISKISLKKVRNIKGKKAKLTFPKIKVSYNEYVSSGVRYEVMYAKNKKFTKGKKIKKFAGTLNDKTKTLAKLKKKTYWVKYRVRIKYWNTKYSRMMYKYSGWSKAKKVKIRK